MKASVLTLVLVGWLAATVSCIPSNFCVRAFAEHSQQESLVSSAEIGNMKTLRRLLDAGISPESHKGSWSALNRAVLFRQAEAVEALPHAGADINAHNPHIGSAVYLAAAGRRDALLSRLLERGADPNLTPVWGLAWADPKIERNLCIYVHTRSKISLFYPTSPNSCISASI